MLGAFRGCQCKLLKDFLCSERHFWHELALPGKEQESGAVMQNWLTCTLMLILFQFCSNWPLSKRVVEGLACLKERSAGVEMHVCRACGSVHYNTNVCFAIYVCSLPAPLPVPGYCLHRCSDMVGTVGYAASSLGLLWFILCLGCGHG